jgi:hypothetical protein
MKLYIAISSSLNCTNTNVECKYCSPTRSERVPIGGVRRG